MNFLFAVAYLFLFVSQVNVLSSYSGVNRTKGNQPKLLKKIVNCIMDSKFMATFNYSGKTTKKDGPRKNSFKDQTNVVALLYSIVSNIDKHFVEADFTEFLKEICKRATE